MTRHDYLIAVVFSALTSWLVTRFVQNLAMKRGWIRPPTSSRHVHCIPVPRLGGVAIFAATSLVVGAVFYLPSVLGLPSGLHSREVGILGPAALIFILGLYDDVRSVTARSKFLVQTVAAILLYIEGFGVSHMDLLFGSHTLTHFVGLPLTVLWVLLITNAFNLIDGLDGLAAGSALFSTVVVFVVSLFLGNSFVSFLTIVLAGAILGFLPFNFNPAKIFLGDSGSLFIGFLLSALGLAGAQKAPTMVAVAIPVVSFGLPILDVLLSVARRFLRGKPLFEGDRDHIHHKLLAHGLSQRGAALILYGVTAGFGLLSLSLLHGQQFIAVVLAVAGSGVCLGVQRLGYHEFSELQRVAQRTLDQRKIIANHLTLRHAGESLRNCRSYAALREILRDTLLPLGFDGFEYVLPARGSPPEALEVSGNNHRAVFGVPEKCVIAPEGSWTLKLSLISTSGNECGSLWLFWKRRDKPFLLDINLLSGDFQAALACAVERSIGPNSLSALERQPDVLALTARAGSM